MNFLKRFSPFETLLTTAILSIHLYAAFSDAYNFASTWFIRDDAYYYFKVAQNIGQGLGSTFDGINLTNGYHPLWMLVCIPIFAFARFDLILPLRILLMVMAGFNAATAILIYRLVKENLSQAVAMTAACFWSFNTYIHFTVYKPGLETPLAAFAVALLIYKLSQFEKSWRIKPVTTQKMLTLALVATIVMFSRLDLVFLVIICGIWIIFRGKPIRFLLPLDIVIIFASMACSVALRTGISQYNLLYAPSATQAVVLVLTIKIIFLYFFGAYQHPNANSILKTIRQIGLALTASSAIAAGLYILFMHFSIESSFPRSAFAIDWAISLVLIIALRLVARWFGNQKITTGPQTETSLIDIQTNWKKWLTESFSYYGVLGGTLASYMLYNKIVFGISSPVSGLVKRWWGSLINTVYERPAPGWTEFLGISFHWSYNSWQLISGMFLWMAYLIYPLYPGSTTTDERFYIVMVAFVILALGILFANARRTLRAITNMALIPLVAGSAIQILSYSTTAYGGVKEWYWVSQMIFETLIGSLLLDLILSPLQRLPWRVLHGKIKASRLVLESASIGFCIFMIYSFGYYVVSTMHYNYFPADRPYLEVLPYIEQNTQPGDIIGMTGGGNAGYFIHNRTIVNMDGLINSNEYFHALQNGTAATFLRKRKVTIIFASPRLLELPPYNGQFTRYLENYSEYGGKNLMYLLEEPKY